MISVLRRKERTISGPEGGGEGGSGRSSKVDASRASFEGQKKKHLSALGERGTNFPTSSNLKKRRRKVHHYTNVKKKTTSTMNV